MVGLMVGLMVSLLIADRDDWHYFAAFEGDVR